MDLNPLREYLVAEDIVRVPRIAGDAPPLWLDPETGAPAPGDKKGVEDGPLVISAFPTGGIPAKPQEAFTRIDIVDFWLRSGSSEEIAATEIQLRDALIDKRQWDMAGQLVVESLQWRPLQRLRSDEQGFTYITAYSFQTLV